MALLSRKEREKARHREEILEAALGLFSRKGFTNVSMREIADKSEFAIGTLYKFFGDKDSLFESLLGHYGEKIVGEVSEILDGCGDEAQRLIAFIRCQPRILEKYSEVMKVHSAVFRSRAIALTKIRDRSKVKEILMSKLTKLLDRGIRNGLFRVVDPEITAKSVCSIIETIAFEMAGRFQKSRVIDQFQKIEQLFIDGLLASATRRKKSMDKSRGY